MNLSAYATKAEFNGATRVDTSNLVSKSNLAKLKAKFDKIDADKLKIVPADLNKLSNVTNNEVVKKTLYDKFVAKVNNIDTSEYVLKSKYNTDKSDLEKKINNADKKICDASGLVKKHRS